MYYSVVLKPCAAYALRFLGCCAGCVAATALLNNRRLRISVEQINKFPRKLQNSTIWSTRFYLLWTAIKSSLFGDVLDRDVVAFFETGGAQPKFDTPPVLHI